MWRPPWSRKRRQGPLAVLEPAGVQDIEALRVAKRVQHRLVRLPFSMRFGM